uniref:Uncharacterized protein n=1 Tax=Gossypium raimondii TaxID=29730 RepID=A0A0D2QJ51_GOSRA|nr:hypothetical protein B456_009G192900 [Gossypium raimondii]
MARYVIHLYHSKFLNNEPLSHVKDMEDCHSAVVLIGSKHILMDSASLQMDENLLKRLNADLVINSFICRNTCTHGCRKLANLCSGMSRNKVKYSCAVFVIA